MHRNPETGKPTHEFWFHHGAIERLGGGPATTTWDDKGRIERQTWQVGQQLHREDGPAHIVYDYKTGIMTFEEYYRHGKYHRDGNLPARIHRDSETIDYSENYYIEGQLHRSNGPALITVSSDSGTKAECWYRYGVQHRTDGPAVIVRNYETGEVVEVEYYQHGHLVRPPSPSFGPS